jgi:hypothetical protein
MALSSMLVRIARIDTARSIRAERRSHALAIGREMASRRALTSQTHGKPLHTFRIMA